MKQSSRSSARIELQQLESRTLFSGACMSDIDSAPTVHEALALTTLATSPYVKIKGNYDGSVVSNTFGGATFGLTLTFSKYTHTGHFVGTAVFHVLGQDYTGTFTGRVTTTRHVIVTFSGGGISGGLDGKASHTGGSIKGTYSVSGSISDSGTFKAAKP